MKKPNTFQARQGDVFIERTDGAKPMGHELPREAGRIVLAHGEATGHAHAVRSAGAKLFSLPEDRSQDGDRVWAEAVRMLHVGA